MSGQSPGHTKLEGVTRSPDDLSADKDTENRVLFWSQSNPWSSSNVQCCNLLNNTHSGLTGERKLERTKVTLELHTEVLVVLSYSMYRQSTVVQSIAALTNSFLREILALKCKLEENPNIDLDEMKEDDLL